MDGRSWISRGSKPSNIFRLRYIKKSFKFEDKYPLHLVMSTRLGHNDFGKHLTRAFLSHLHILSRTCFWTTTTPHSNIFGPSRTSMATSFSAYASQYLKKQNGASTLSSSQPMFFSFTTDDGSRQGGNDTDLDDMDDPHLRESGMTQGTVHDDDEDPYLRLDEDEHVGSRGFHQVQQRGQAVPLIARSTSPQSPQGWLAHLGRSSRSPSPASSDSSPPADLLVAPPAPQGQKRPNPHAPLPPPSREPHSLSLTDSLLPRDGLTRPLDVFSLPDPRHTPRKRRKYHDATWISLWLGFVTLCIFFCILLLFVTKRPVGIPSSMLPYTILLRTVPMLIILTFVSAVAAYVHVYLLRIFVKPVMIATSVFIPATLFISAIWAFVGSFMWDGDTPPTWGETVG